MPQSTAQLTAGQVMVYSAALLNDPNRTDYTDLSMIAYLNIAIEELNEHLEEANIPLTNQVSEIMLIKVGDNSIINLPFNLVEIQEVAERQKGSNSSFIQLPRREFPDAYPPSSSLLFWCWIEQRVKFNTNGANVPIEVQLKYVQRAIRSATDANGVIGTINAASYLIYKTAALCAEFIGENESRAGVLNQQAELALERIIGISNKGKQQIMTRHRPFRAGYKMRGY